MGSLSIDEFDSFVAEIYGWVSRSACKYNRMPSTVTTLVSLHDSKNGYLKL